MKFSYEDLISGDAIPVKGVGHLISPQLTKLKPTVGIGTFTYHLYLNVLTWDKESVIGFMKQSLGGKADELLNNEKITTFDIMTLFDYSIELLQNAMAFFMQEKLVWNKKIGVSQLYQKKQIRLLDKLLAKILKTFEI